jgi:hypothetical protein
MQIPVIAQGFSVQVAAKLTGLVAKFVKNADLLSPELISVLLKLLVILITTNMATVVIVVVVF